MYSKKGVITGALVILMSLVLGFQAQSSFRVAAAKSNTVEPKVKKAAQEHTEVKNSSQKVESSVITRAEFSKMLDEIFVYQIKADMMFSDVKNSDWYRESALKVDAAGILKRDAKGNFNGNKPVTRQEAALILYRAFYHAEDNSQKTIRIADSKAIGGVYKTAAEYMVKNGYMITGSGNTFSPKGLISSDELTTILHSMTGEIISEAGFYTDDITGNLFINAPGVNLEDMTIKGNLYIAQGVGEGDVTLDRVTVNGRVFVLGGGENSIKLQDTIVRKGLVSAKGNGKVRIEANGSTSIAATNVAAGTTLYNATKRNKAFGEVTVKMVPQEHSVRFVGNFGNVKVESAKANVTLTKGMIQRLELSESAKGSVIELEEDTTVDVLVIRSNSTITGKGVIMSASIEAHGVNLSKEPGTILIGDNITVIIAGISRNKSSIGETADSTVSSGESFSGGNSGGVNPGGDNSGGEAPGGDTPGGNGNGETPIPNNHTVKVIEFEYVRYLVIQFAEGSLKDYAVTVDGEAVLFTPVTTEKSIVKYELSDRNEHKVKIVKGTKIQEYSVK
ncbi:hypothetical protein acsn021_34570 [Anaerocolumna cellulosilytica]|uniref:Uncharacterized protein n=1 Tax=Anaerocolumna cellulosilytica TaxID=433286 RepID=A0A6S6RAC2_9FIRM|nr:S-layer homology domain-containing protein [Anaerocolumna cellulosilytica]MBB5195355.1 hypothetical protein [Anaerocolumna cellulosilytica]BCJ95888.1 hypothetical protein acsn021_34570 [Anaerocolumna cellulosilytica]